MPATPEDLARRLEELGIEVNTVQHAPVFTVDQARAVRGDPHGAHSKNLFVRNKKGVMLLLVCPEDLALNLKDVGERLGVGRLSFGSPERLMRYLGVIPGAVTPFAVLNDSSCKVRVVLERRLCDEDTLHFHPLDNARTTAIATVDLIRFLEAEHHPAEIVDLGDG